MNKNLAIFLDGTWNDPTSNTNVWRLKTLVARAAADGAEQMMYYDTGVGVSKWQTLRGGIGGYGLSQNIRQAYQWLVENHEDGDRIFIFGFSRGAFTARSLAGVIKKCGLLRPGSLLTVKDVFSRYERMKDDDSVRAINRYRLDDPNLTDEDRWLKQYSRRVPIRYLGIWDTVGTLGIPFGNIPGISRKRFTFHDQYLSKTYERGRQALAMDENRKAYNAGLWTHYVPVGNDGEPIEERWARHEYPNFEQRWFIGAHANVGGGYPQDRLAQVPLRWIQEGAEDAGLAFRSQVPLSGREHLDGEVVDSYKRFLKGIYRAIKFGKRFWRDIGLPPRDFEDDTRKAKLEIVNESIDASVIERWRANADYRPENLTAWAKENGVDLATVDLDKHNGVPTRPDL